MGTFNEYGCACRCLLKLLADKGSPMSVDDFLKSFPYPVWQPSHSDPKPGVTNIDMVCDIARNLRLASSLHVFRCYTEVQRRFVIEKLSVLIYSEVHLDPERNDPINHVSLLTAIDSVQFSLWCPLQDGSDILATFPTGHWDTKLCYGLVLFK